ncbi:MAG TPA: DUF2059 domain-containing protein [Gammaproteobacteria bacterium]|nr:DUF2059 domain-containing protein [Gammaproteobacteria bacterium]
MKILNYILLIMLMSISFNLYADEASKKIAIKELLSVSNADKSKDQIWDRMKVTLPLAFGKLGGKKKDKELLDKLFKETEKVLNELIKWEEIEPKFIEVYDKAFSEKEIKAITTFYKTPAGKTMLEKWPQVAMQLGKVTQGSMLAFVPKLQEIMKEIGVALKEKRAKEKAAKKDEIKNNKDKEEKTTKKEEVKSDKDTKD